MSFYTILLGFARNFPLGIHEKMVILQPAVEYNINIKNKEL